MKSVPRLHFAPRISRMLVAIALAVTCCTAALALMLPIPMLARAALATCCIVVGSWETRGLVRPPRSVMIGIDRQIVWTDHEARAEGGTIADATFVSGLFTAVVWRPAGARRSRVWAVAPDSLNAEDRRRLRVWLRYGALPVDGAALGANTAPMRGEVADSPLSHA